MERGIFEKTSLGIDDELSTSACSGKELLLGGLCVPADMFADTDQCLYADPTTGECIGFEPTISEPLEQRSTLFPEQSAAEIPSGTTPKEEVLPPKQDLTSTATPSGMILNTNAAILLLSGAALAGFAFVYILAHKR